ncbi:MAG TPA: ATP-binding protein [Actinocrinis sp.]|uniref:ATP-binding protein n=1 Tax=Actinocrinis sp. TaxID=1920516 RepID=UPI002D48C819|nr:ATP-binding protein [Actinocrinis sp.]HZU54730.1 ATP-binding protein [Actinocrinis sp.]
MSGDPAHARHSLDGSVASITQARELAREYFAARTPPLGPALVRDALLAVSELVTNAVRHAPGPFELELGDDGRLLTIAVSDTDPTTPAPRPADLLGGGGVGLHVLNGLAGRVETTTHPGGKTVVVSLERAGEMVPPQRPTGPASSSAGPRATDR